MGGDYSLKDLSRGLKVILKINFLYFMKIAKADSSPSRSKLFALARISS